VDILSKRKTRTSAPLSNYGVREMKMRTMIAVVAVVLTAVFASTALAAGNSSSTSAYGSKASKVQAVLAAKTTVKKPAKATHVSAPKKVAVKSAATLPFTGLDLGFIAGAGVVLLGMGLSLRRVTRKAPQV
jgi:hypothetical protein